MQTLLIALGAVIVLVGVYDVFRTFVHPSARGRISSALVRLPWVLSRAVGGAPARAAGPAGVVLVIVTWIVLQVVGWTLIYIPYVESSFSYSDQVDPAQLGTLSEALYMSVVVLGTLGLGDVVFSDPVMRFISPVESLIGLTILTAAISWMMQLYPALARRRAWALHVSHLKAARFAEGLGEPAGAGGAAGIVHSLASIAAQVRVDFGQHAESYYFTERDPATCLPSAMQYCAQLADAAERSSDAALRSAGAVLRVSVDDLAGFIRGRFLPRAASGTTESIRATHADHGCDGPS